MKILLKKDGSGKTTTNIKEIAKELELASLLDHINKLEVQVKKLQKHSYIEEKDVISITENKFIRINELINITHAASIEKLKKVSKGTIYYNNVKDEVRIKTKNGWTSLKYK